MHFPFIFCVKKICIWMENKIMYLLLVKEKKKKIKSLWHNTWYHYKNVSLWNELVLLPTNPVGSTSWALVLYFDHLAVPATVFHCMLFEIIGAMIFHMPNLFPFLFISTGNWWWGKRPTKIYADKLSQQLGLLWHRWWLEWWRCG